MDRTAANDASDSATDSRSAPCVVRSCGRHGVGVSATPPRDVPVYGLESYVWLFGCGCRPITRGTKQRRYARRLPESPLSRRR